LGENSVGLEDVPQYTILKLKELDAALGLLSPEERITYKNILSNESYGRYKGRNPPSEESTRLQHNGNVYQAFRGSAFNDITSREDTFIDSVEITECHSVTFLARVQLFLQDSNAPWVFLPDLSNEIRVYHRMARVEAPAHDSCDSNAFVLANSVRSETTFYTAVSQVGSAVAHITKPNLQK
jgi:hypothetical protein